MSRSYELLPPVDSQSTSTLIGGQPGQLVYLSKKGLTSSNRLVFNNGLTVRGFGSFQGYTTTPGYLKLYDAPSTSSHNITFFASGLSESYNITWPDAQGSANTFLVNDGSGNLSWSSSSVGDFVLNTRTLELSGSTGLTITPTGAQDLSANRTWSLTLSSNLQAYSALPTGTFATSGHTHAIYAEKSLNLSDLNSPTVARTNLGLGTGDSPVFTGVYSSNLYAGTTSAVSVPGALTVVTAAAFNSEGLAAIRIFDAASSPSVVLQMGADPTRNIGFIQAMQPGVAWSTRPLVLQANGGAVTVGTTGSLARLHVRGATVSTSDAFLVENASGILKFSVSDSGTITLGAGLTQNLPLSLNIANQLVAEPAATTRTNLGLGTAAQMASGSFATSGHTHADLVSNTRTLQITGSTGLTVTSSAALDLSTNRVWGLTLSSNLQAYSALPTGTFAGSGHNHDSTYLLKSSNLSDLANVTTARNNLELGTSDSPTFEGLNLIGNSSNNIKTTWFAYTAEATGGFYLGKIRNSSGNDGAIHGSIQFSYDFGSTTVSNTTHFAFAQRSGTARGHWWYEHTDLNPSEIDKVSIRLIDSGGLGTDYEVWLIVGDFGRVVVDAYTRHGGDWQNSGQLTSTTVTTGTVLYDTRNSPTSQNTFGSLTLAQASGSTTAFTTISSAGVLGRATMGTSSQLWDGTGTLVSTGIFAASGHNHNSQYLQIANNLSDLASASVARDNLELGTSDSPNFLNLSLGSGTSNAGTNLTLKDSWGGNYNGTNTVGKITFYNNAVNNVGIAAEVAAGRGRDTLGTGVIIFRTASSTGSLNDVGAFSHTGNLLLGDSTFIQGTAGIAKLQVRSSSALLSLENASGTVRFSVANNGTTVINAGLSQNLPLSLNASNQLVAETAATTRTNLGLGTAAQMASGTFALASHTHAASSITSGTFDNTRISSGNVTQHEASINHDNLSGFVGNEHIDHSGVSITAGTGLSGGGDLTTSRTLNLADTAVSSGTYGSATQVPQFTVDAQGRLTNATNVSITASGLGAVTSVGLSAPAIFNVTNSPVTGSGTLTLALANQVSGVVFAGPTGGASANPTFRLLVSDDIPSLAISKITSLQTSLDSKLATGSVINALAGLDSSTGFLAQTGASSFAKRTLTGTANQISITNTTGTGNPVFSIATPFILSDSTPATNALTTFTRSGVYTTVSAIVPRALDLNNNIAASGVNTSIFRTTMRGIFSGYVTAGNTDSGYFIGAFLDSKINSASHLGTLGSTYGWYVDTGFGSSVGSGTVSSVYGGRVQLNRNSVASSNNFFGFYIGEAGSTSTITNRYGIYETLASGAINYFANNVGIGIAAPLQPLHVVGTGRFSALAGIGTGIVLANANGDLTATRGTAAQLLDGTGSFVSTGIFAASGHTHADLVPTSRTLQFTGGDSITVTSSAAQDLSANRSWTINTIQDIRTTDSPTFASLLVGAGTVSAPSLRFSTDTDTGLYAFTTNTIGFAASGTLVARIDPNGLGIGTSPSSTYPLTVSKSGTDVSVGAANFVTSPTKSDASSTTALGTVSVMQSTVTSSGILNAYNFYVHQNASYVSAGVTNNGTWAGGYFIASVANSNHNGTIGTTYGNLIIHGASTAAAATGHVSNTYGLRVLTELNGTISIGNYFQLYLGKTGTTTTITGTRYGIYQVDTDAINYFGGLVQYGSVNHTANTVAYFDGSRYLKSSSVTFTELGYLSGVSSAIQTQLNTKVASSLTLQITGNGITVTASSAQNLSANRTWGLALTNTGVSSGTYGNATTIPQVTIGADGRVTSATGVAVDIVSDYNGLTGKPASFSAIPVTGVNRYENFSFIWAPSTTQLYGGALIPVGQWLEVPYNPHDSSAETFDIERFHAMVYSTIGTTAATSVIKIQVSSNPTTGFTDIASSTLTLTSTGGYAFPTAVTTGITQTVTSGQWLAIYVVSSTDNDALGYGSEHEQLKCHIMLRAT